MGYPVVDWKNNPAYNAAVQAIGDIFQIWPDTAAFATAIGQKIDTVYKWKRSGRIPDTAWDAIIVAAGEQGTVLTIAEIHAANRPALQRGRPAHRSKARRLRSVP